VAASDQHLLAYGLIGVAFGALLALYLWKRRRLRERS